MNRTWNFERCITVLNDEIALLQKISLVQDSVRQTVMAREWTDFDWKMAQINQLGEEFSQLEAERAGIFTALKEKFGFEHKDEVENEPLFHNLAAKLPDDQGKKLSGVFRELKMETLKLKAQNETFAGYLNEMKIIAAAWMEAIFPSQSGKLYTRKGVQASGDLRSMVFNRSI